MTGSSEEEGEEEKEEDQDNRKLRSVFQSLWIFIIKDLEINVNKARALTATRNRKISRRIFKYLNISERNDDICTSMLHRPLQCFRLLLGTLTKVTALEAPNGWSESEARRCPYAMLYSLLLH